MKKCILLLAVWLTLFNAVADTVTLEDGHHVSGVVLGTNGNNLVVLRSSDVGTYFLPIVKEISIEKVEGQPAAGGKIPSWKQIVLTLAKQGWAKRIHQIPATVIDNGVLKNVPYVSFRSGDYEINIYGDLDNPAGVEAGVSASRENGSAVKDNCISFIASLLSDTNLSAVVRTVDRSKHMVARDGLSIEVTPSTAPDAYGAWWVSIYSESSLNAARASDEELKQISVPKSVAADKAADWSKDELKQARTLRVMDPAAELRRTQQAQAQRAAQSQVVVPARTEPERTLYSVGSSYSGRSSGGGSVYVRSYHRKDGTYVQGHTRRSPRR